MLVMRVGFFFTRVDSHKSKSSSVCKHYDIKERLRFTFTTNGKRELVPRDQVFPLIVVDCLLLQLKNK